MSVSAAKLRRNRIAAAEIHHIERAQAHDIANLLFKYDVEPARARLEYASDDFVRAVEREWARWQEHPAWDASPGLETVYFGGGTPSLWDPDEVAAALAALNGCGRADPKQLAAIGYTPANITYMALSHYHGDHVANAGYMVDPHTRPMGLGLELSARRKDGTEFPVDNLLSLIHSGKDSMVMAVIRDITEPKRTAEGVRKTNDELMALVTELQRRDREMQSLISMDDLLQSCTSQEDAYKVIGFAAGELFEGHTGCLAVLQASGRYLEIVARWGTGSLGDPIFSLDDCWALRRGQLHEVVNAETGLLCRHFVSHPNTRYLCVPLTVQGEILGVFCLAGAPAHTSDHQIGQLQLAVTVSEF